MLDIKRKPKGIEGLPEFKKEVCNFCKKEIKDRPFEIGVGKFYCGEACFMLYCETEERE